jgi:hypothetical protein
VTRWTADEIAEARELACEACSGLGRCDAGTNKCDGLRECLEEIDKEKDDGNDA